MADFASAFLLIYILPTFKGEHVVLLIWRNIIIGGGEIGVEVI